MWVIIKVKNISDSIKKVEFWGDVIDRGLEVKNPDGKVTDNKFGLFVERLEPFRYLAPDSELTVAREIQSRFGDGTGSTAGFKNRFFTRGEHEIRFSRKSSFYADPIKFTVEEPPKDEKSVYDEFCSVCAMVKNKTCDEMLDIHYNFAKNHRESRYFELAVYSMLVNQSSFKMNNEQLDFCLWYVDNYFNSNYMPAAIGTLIQVTYNLRGGKQGVIDFLNGIMRKYPNTKASKTAYEYLNNPVTKELYMK